MVTAAVCIPDLAPVSNVSWAVHRKTTAVTFDRIPVYLCEETVQYCSFASCSHVGACMSIAWIIDLLTGTEHNVRARQCYRPAYFRMSWANVRYQCSLSAAGRGLLLRSTPAPTRCEFSPRQQPTRTPIWQVK